MTIPMDTMAMYPSPGEGEMIAIELSYREMSLDFSGKVISRETKEIRRKQNGYCLTCPGIPVRLYDVRKSRLNPLWSSKSPRTCKGESLNGQCLKCNPIMDLKSPSQHHRPSDARRSSSCGSQTSSSVESNGSQHSREENFAPQEKFRPVPRRNSLHSSTPVSRSDLKGSAHERARRRNSIHNTGSPLPNNSDHRKSLRTSGRAHGSHRFDGDSSRPFSYGPDGRLFQEARLSPRRASSESVVVQRAPACPTLRSSTRLRHVHTSSERGARTIMMHSYSTRNAASSNTDPHTRRSLRVEDIDEGNEGDDIVDNIRPFLEDLQAAKSFDVLADILMNSLDSHCTNEKMQIFCMRKIVECAKSNPDFSAKLGSANCAQQILRAMKVFSNSLEVQKRACDALAALSAVESNRVLLTRAGTCTHVAKTISLHLGDLSLVGRAIRVLRIMSLECEARELLQRMSATKQVVEAMQCNLSSASIQRDGCALLSNLAVEPSKQKVAVVDKSVLDAVVMAIRAHHENQPVVASGCFALKNLSYDETNLRSLRRIDGVNDTLQNAARNKGVEDADLVLERILISKAQDDSLEQEGYESLIALVDTRSDHPDVVNEIMATLGMFTWSPRLTAACLKILRSFASRSDAFKAKILSSETLEKLGASLRAFEKDPTVQLEARELSRVLYGEVLDMMPTEGMGSYIPISAERASQD